MASPEMKDLDIGKVFEDVTAQMPKVDRKDDMKDLLNLDHMGTMN